MSFCIFDDGFGTISEKIVNAEDYFDFPSSLLAFAESLKNSALFVENGVFFRKRGRYLTLITHQTTPTEVQNVLDYRIKKGYLIKVLNHVHKDYTGFKMVPYGREFWTSPSYNIESAIENRSSKTKATILRKLRNAKKSYTIGDKVNETSVLDVFEEWMKGASKRHFMVVQGHYLRYIQRYFVSKNNVCFIPFLDYTGRLFGIAGYEVFQNAAQITLMKHRFGDNNFPIFFWTETIKHILSNHSVNKIFCGSTADELKMLIGLSDEKSYKIKIK